ncbi:MAG: hypothetical protein IJ456_11165 [Bacteroides sp.]|nr:hypothetical protein [Bacteroides sp.]
MKFNTQVCTTREQSERLLSLGLKKETVDMYLTNRFVGNNGTPMFFIGTTHKPSTVLFSKEDIPAWSLHRLIAMISDAGPFVDTDGNEWDSSILVSRQIVKFVAFPVVVKTFNNDNLYDNLIDCIEWLIKENHFNKQYLNESL